MLSGIGPADELKAQGIDLVHDLPGVRLGREILAQAGSAPYLDSEPLPGPNAKTDDEILAYIR